MLEGCCTSLGALSSKQDLDTEELEMTNSEKSHSYPHKTSAYPAPLPDLESCAPPGLTKVRALSKRERGRGWKWRSLGIRELYQWKMRFGEANIGKPLRRSPHLKS